MAIPRNLQHPRDEIIQTMQRIYRYRMTTTSVATFQSATAMISGSRRTRRRRKATCVVRTLFVCAGDGKVEGAASTIIRVPVPSSDLCSASRFERCRACASRRAGRFQYLSQNARHACSIKATLCGEPALAPYALPGSEALATNIAKTFATPLHQEPVARGAQTLPNCVVLENHGVVVGAIDLALAYQRFEALEFTAKTIIRARHLGPVRYARLIS